MLEEHVETLFLFTNIELPCLYDGHYQYVRVAMLML